MDTTFALDTISMPSSPRSADGSPRAFRGLLQGIAIAAGLIHSAFFALFVWSGVDMMAVVNVASVLCYILTFELARRGKTGAAFALTAIEVVLHAIVATIVIGWDSGFHHYIFLIIPVTVVSTLRPLRIKAAVVAVEVIAYVSLDFALRQAVPPHFLMASVLKYLYYFNVVGTLLILTFIAACYYYLINEAQAALRVVANTDSLTQLPNRHFVTKLIRHHERRVARGHHRLSFVICDVDHFKKVNDTYGHDSGDAVLKAVGRALADVVRNKDVLSRWGGEEFLAVLPDTDRAGAAVVAERLRVAVEKLRIVVRGEELKISLTLGVSAIENSESAEQAIARADAALYEGKHAGRNRVVIA